MAGCLLSRRRLVAPIYAPLAAKVAAALAFWEVSSAFRAPKRVQLRRHARLFCFTSAARALSVFTVISFEEGFPGFGSFDQLLQMVVPLLRPQLGLAIEAPDPADGGALVAQ